MKTKHFLNLTNGIEALQRIDWNGNDDIQFIRIQSTTLEGRNWLKLLYDLDHNFLLHLAVGNSCFVYDYGTNRIYSKTISKGIPIIRFILNRYWYGLDEKCLFLSRDGSKSFDETEYVTNIYNNLFIFDSNVKKNKLKTKLNYYKKFLDNNQVYLYGVSDSTSNDGNYPLFKQILINNIDKI